VRFENRLAFEITGFDGKLTLWIHWSHDWQAIAHTDFVVFLPVTWSDVNSTRALILSNEFTKDYLGITLDPRVTANNPFECRPAPAAFGNLIVPWFNRQSLHRRGNQLLIENQFTFRSLNQSIQELRMNGDGLVGWQRPRRRCPDHKESSLF